MDQNRAIEIFKAADVLKEGHFVLTSGRHSGKYFQCARILEFPNYTSEVAGFLADSFRDDKIDVVVAPAMGGIIIGYEVARNLQVRNMFTERVEGKMTFRRGFALKPGERVLVIEDVVTTGGSVMEVIEQCKAFGAEIVGVGLLADRSNGTVDFGVKTVPCLRMEVISYEASDCPLCKEGLPIEKPGSRDLKAK